MTAVRLAMSGAPAPGPAAGPAPGLSRVPPQCYTFVELTKAKAEALKKPSQPKAKEGEKKAPDEASTVTASNVTTTASTDKTKVKAKEKEQKRKEREKEREERRLTAKPSVVQQQVLPIEEKEIKPSYVLCSFEPDPIVEKDERERVNLLAQRDFLIRSYGMLEQIYLVMKKMGTLRPEDERKYGVYGRLSVVSNSPKRKSKKNKEIVPQKMHGRGDQHDEPSVHLVEVVMGAPSGAARARFGTNTCSIWKRHISPFASYIPK